MYPPFYWYRQQLLCWQVIRSRSETRLLFYLGTWCSLFKIMGFDVIRSRLRRLTRNVMFPPVWGWEIILSARQSHMQCNPYGPHIFVQRHISPSILLARSLSLSLFFFLRKVVYYLLHALRLPVRSSVCMRQRHSHWTNFLHIWYRRAFIKMCWEDPDLSKSPLPKCRTLYIKIQMCGFFLFSVIYLPY